MEIHSTNLYLFRCGDGMTLNVVGFLENLLVWGYFSVLKRGHSQLLTRFDQAIGL